ncbi:hypothetical protein Tco_1447681 [Tanacetum coccineum]
MPPKPHWYIAAKDENFFSESITSVPAVATSKVKTSESKPKSASEPLIEDWISDSEDENETEFKYKQRKPSFAKVEFVKSNEHVKIPRDSIKKVENNNYNHLIKDYDFYEKKMVEKPVWNNASRVNHQNSQRLTHPHPKEVLMKSGHKTLNIARQNSSKAAVSVNTAYLRPTVNSARTISNVFNRAHSHVRRPFNKFTTNKNSNLNEKANTVRRNVTTIGSKAVVSDNKGNEANAVKASSCLGNPQLELQEKGVIDSGCSKHMTGNKSYLSDYEEIDGGFVAFGEDPKGGKITGKGRKPALSLMRPFGCPVTILNTLDHIGTKACDNASKARMETVPGKDYILLPMWPADLLFSQNLKDFSNAGFKPSGEEEKMDTKDPGNENAASER